MGHVFRHPKYYEELKRKGREERLASGHKQQAIDETVPHCDIEEAASSKPQAPSLDKNEAQASSPKQQGSSFKP